MENVGLYCLEASNACFATVPIFVYYNSAMEDHFYTTMADPGPNYAGYVSNGIVCYIWE